MIILGVDPGLAALGWAVVERKGQRVSLVAHGCLTTAPADGSDLDRVGMLARDLGALIVGAHPAAVATEAWCHYGQSATTQAHALGLVLGMVRAVCVGAGVRHVEGERAQGWRTALGLSRSASKAACQERVRAVLGLDKVIKPQHASDAAAVAIVAAKRGREVT
jgi:crossover junction endodeoxyribonuclease RuvC